MALFLLGYSQIHVWSHFYLGDAELNSLSSTKAIETFGLLSQWDSDERIGSAYRSYIFPYLSR